MIKRSHDFRSPNEIVSFKTKINCISKIKFVRSEYNHLLINKQKKCSVSDFEIVPTTGSKSLLC